VGERDLRGRWVGDERRRCCWDSREEVWEDVVELLQRCRLILGVSLQRNLLPLRRPRRTRRRSSDLSEEQGEEEEVELELELWVVEELLDDFLVQL